MTTISEPVTHDITIIQGTDHTWLFRRKTGDDEILKPDAVKAQIRNKPNGTLWAELVTSIDEQGWIYCNLPKSATGDDIWYSREIGHWDLFVTFDSKTYKWVQGAVTVEQRITSDE